MSTLRDRDNARRVAKVRREARARAAAVCQRPDSDFPRRERGYAEKHPHLLEHKHCGLCLDDGADAPRRWVKLPNGLKIFTSWYKVPTTDKDAKRAFEEQVWLLRRGGDVRVPDHAYLVGRST